MSNFETIMARLKPIEGGYVNNLNDPGGPTRWGICKHSYPLTDIENLTWEAACALYKRDFYDPADLDSQPLGIANQMLDFAINSGTGTAARALQRAVGVVDDGHIGPHTLEAVKATEPHDLIMLFLAERGEWMAGCKNWADAGKGWMRRLCKELRYGAADV